MMSIKFLSSLLCIGSLIFSIITQPRKALATVHPAPLYVKLPQRPPAAAPPKFALLVGINTYLPSRNPTKENYIKPLGGCENDVDDMRSVLTGLYNFPNDTDHI